MNDLEELERHFGPSLRRVFGAVLAEPASAAVAERAVVGEAAPGLIPVAALRRPARSRGLVGVAAVVALLAGGGFVALSVDRRAERRAQLSGSVAAAPQPATSVGPTTIVGGDAAVPILLPGAAPSGFSLVDLTVNRGSPRPDPFVASARFVRRDAHGTIVGQASMTLAPASAEQGGVKRNLRVHGLPASRWDSGEGIVVSWTEAGFDVGVRGIGLTEQETLDVAEASDIDGALPSIGLTDPPLLDLEPAPVGESARDGTPSVTVEYLADHRIPGVFVSFSSGPSDGQTIESVAATMRARPELTVVDVTVDGAPAVLTTSRPESLGRMGTLTWFRDGVGLHLVGPSEEVDLLALASSVAPSTVGEARTLYTRVQQARRSLPEIGRATLPNGLVASIHASSKSADVVCLQAPIQRCDLIQSESSLIGEAQSVLIGSFQIDEATWWVGWAAGAHQPVVVKAGTDSGPLADTVTTEAGTFFAVDNLGGGETGVRLDPGTTAVYGGATFHGEDLLAATP